MIIINSGKRERVQNNSFDPLLKSIAGDDQVQIPYFNQQTQQRAQEGGAMYEQPDTMNFNPQNQFSGFSDPSITGGNKNPAYKRSDLLGGNASSTQNDEFSEYKSSRMGFDPQPERDAARDARNKKIGTIQAIAQGAVLLRDIIASSNGGFAMGDIGVAEPFMNRLAQADDQYAQQMQAWSQQNLAAQRFNADAANQERLINFRATQDKMSQDFRAEENEKDRAADIAKEERLAKKDAAYARAAEIKAQTEARKAQEQQDRYEQDRMQEAINEQSRLVRDLNTQFSGLGYEARNGEAGAALQKQIEEESAIAERMRKTFYEARGLGEEGKATPEEPRDNGGGNHMSRYVALKEIAGKTYDLGDNSFTAEQLLEAGWTPEQIKQLNDL